MKFKWSEITKKYIGKPYKLGSFDPEEGLDCFSFILLMMKEQGFKVDFEEACNYYKINDYKNIESKEVLTELCKKYLKSKSRKIDRAKARPGNLAFIKYKKTTLPTILDANRKVISAFHDGGIMLLNNNIEIVEVRKWLVL